MTAPDIQLDVLSDSALEPEPAPVEAEITPEVLPEAPTPEPEAPAPEPVVEPAPAPEVLTDQTRFAQNPEMRWDEATNEYVPTGNTAFFNRRGDRVP